VAETQADVAEYVLDLFDAHGDCREKLRALVRIAGEEITSYPSPSAGSRQDGKQ
jgi:hypothetical protein